MLPRSIFSDSALQLCRVAAPLLFAIALSGCKPTFKPKGSLLVGAVPYYPVSCHVLGCGGIELADAAGARLQLSIPPQRLDAWQEIHGTPRVKYDPGSGKPAVDLGVCGSLVLRGEGYHEPKGRAASGKVTLACVGDVAAQGELEFTGCL